MLVTALLITPLPGLAEESQFSGFLSDYSGLKKRTTDTYVDYIYVAPGVKDTVAKYTTVMIDQPEIFIHPDSKYKGIKADDIKALADALRGAVAREVSSAYQIVDQPGPNVMYVALAATNLHLKKKKRGLLGYTPIGLVAGATKSIVVQDITKKISLKALSVETEARDSQTGELLVAIVESRAGGKQEPASWDELEAIFAEYGKRVRCRLDNARLVESERADCVNRR